jgi:hypothetical protein
LELVIDNEDLAVRKSYLRRLAQGFMDVKIQVLEMLAKAERKDDDIVKIGEQEEPSENEERVRFNELDEVIPIVSNF